MWIGYKLVEPQVKPEYNLHHPDYRMMVEPAFTAGGKQFYRFKDEYRMSTGRYKYYYAQLREIDLRMSLDKLQEFIKAFENCLNGVGKKKEINMGNLWQLINNRINQVIHAYACLLCADRCELQKVRQCFE